MSANDYTNFPPGTHMLDDRVSLTHPPFHTKSDFDKENGNGNGKKDIILKPTPSDDPDDPLVTTCTATLGLFMS